jgi:hypothetical protein
MRNFKKLALAASSVAAAVGATSAHAAGTGGMADIFAAVDLSTVVAFVTATGLIVIGICMAFKGIDLGKRGVKKA